MVSRGRSELDKYRKSLRLARGDAPTDNTSNAINKKP